MSKDRNLDVWQEIYVPENLTHCQGKKSNIDGWVFDSCQDIHRKFSSFGAPTSSYTLPYDEDFE